MAGRLRMIVARAIAAERVRRGWTQADLAARLAWTKSTVHRAEAGERGIDLDELPDICEALGVTVADLLREAPESELRKMGL